MRVAAAGVALGVIVILTACDSITSPPTTPPTTSASATPAPSSPPAPPASTPTVGTPTPTPTRVTPTAKPPTPGIRSVDFGNRTWKDPVTPGRTVALKDGTAPYGAGGRYTMEDERPTYLDVDGDGHDDALVKLLAEEGNGYAESTTVWLWRADIAQPTQVLPAISVDERCGNPTTRVRLSTSNTFTLTRLLRQDEACAVRPTKEATLTIRIKNGFAWQAAPKITALNCPYVMGRGLNFPGSDFGTDGPRAWPDPKAPVIITGKDMLAMDTDDSREGVPSGWNRILFISSEADKGDQPPCGYFPQP